MQKKKKDKNQRSITSFLTVQKKKKSPLKNIKEKTIKKEVNDLSDMPPLEPFTEEEWQEMLLRIYKIQTSDGSSDG